MVFTVVHKKIDGLITFDLSPQVPKKRLKLFLGKREIGDLYVQETMTLANSSADGLTRLLTCTIFDSHISSLVRPGILLVPPGLEDTFINEY